MTKIIEAVESVGVNGAMREAIAARQCHELLQGTLVKNVSVTCDIGARRLYVFRRKHFLSRQKVTTV